MNLIRIMNDKNELVLINFADISTITDKPTGFEIQMSNPNIESIKIHSMNTDTFFEIMRKANQSFINVIEIYTYQKNNSMLRGK